MPEQTWSPTPGTPVVEYRSSRWLFIGGLAMLVFFGLAAIVPDVGTPSPRSKMPEGPASFLFGALALGGLMLMIGSVPHMIRFAADERGLWWRAGRKSDLIGWDEVRSVRGQESRPPVQGDPNSKAVLSALVFTPKDRHFENRHSKLFTRPPTPGPEVELRLPSSAIVRQLTQEIARVRPDLVP
ncbi:hypothetical protein ED92_31700 [Amycolatopsis sp. MJM2582]|uniref:hypothetical protein n=1 Tax=Amycolatopsis sp. MJM2582 TaxID=1427749 RepID=UPI000502D6E4|nr:hypothetical protein [Amycolatopsis sp. MJM2582]KFZ78998.1 hypothetical protein ED92_31700 [Amycolatopsis sp. MJM2582]